jgi:hypothetical protein
MEQFISTKFFHILQEASQKDIDIDVHVLESSYDEFVNLLFGCTAINRSTCHNILIYTHVEFTNLTGVSEKKCLILS